ELVIAVQARDFFDQIDFALNVKPPAGNPHGELSLVAWLRDQFETEPLQNCENLVRFDFAAENALRLGDAQERRRLIKLSRYRVDLCAVEFSTSAFNDPVGDQGASYRCGCVVCAALEAV